MQYVVYLWLWMSHFYTWPGIDDDNGNAQNDSTWAAPGEKSANYASFVTLQHSPGSKSLICLLTGQLFKN